MKKLSSSEQTKEIIEELKKNRNTSIIIGGSFSGNSEIRFIVDDLIYSIYPCRKEICEKCNIQKVDHLYSYIIDTLKEKGLLDEDFKKSCCFCKKDFIIARWL